MRRLFGLITALAVSFFAMMPVSAWDKYSFVGDSVYSVRPNSDLQSVPSVHAPTDTSASGADFLNLLSLDSGRVYGFISVYHPPEDVGVVSIPGFDEQRAVPVSGMTATKYVYDYGNGTCYTSFDTSTVDFEQNLNGGEFDGLLSCFSGPYSTAGGGFDPVTVMDVDISSFRSFNTFSLSGRCRAYTDLYPVDAPVRVITDFAILVNGAYVRTFYPDSSNYINFSDFIYTSTSPIKSLQFQFHVQSSSYGADLTSAPMRIVLVADSILFSVLSGSEINDAVNDEGQDAINDEDALQSEWGGSMVDNFNNLNVGNFKYPSGLTSAFSLVSGIFQDIWYAFDDYAILWVFPLTLAILLLVVGRLSKFAGRFSKDGGG